jgi:hypothetical protein
MMREKRPYRTAAAAMLAAIALSVTGCRDQEPAEATKETPAVSAPVVIAENVPSFQPAEPSASNASANQDKQAAAANAVQQAGAAESKAPGSTPARTQKAFDGYTAEKPLLMGVAIGDTKDRTVTLHGSPTGSYTMEDGDDPITVSEYEGFYVGYNKKQLVEFVEIADASVDPGLNGLQLGQSTSVALNALGKPDASTDYVLTYKTKGTVLKLDVDPKTKSVQSIKMFRRGE